MNSLPKIIVITAPSGTGKTTINRRLVAELDNLEFSVSYTTREKREGEKNGVHYWFVTKAEFDSFVAQGQMLEWAEVFGRFYGTSHLEIERITSQGKSVLLEVDVQGWRSVKAKVQNFSSLFILPPNLSELWDRLNKRGTETEETIKKRFMTARVELEFGLGFDHFIVNDDLEKTYQLIKDFLFLGKPLPMSCEEGQDFCRVLLDEFSSFKL